MQYFVNALSFCLIRAFFLEIFPTEVNDTPSFVLWYFDISDTHCKNIHEVNVIFSLNTPDIPKYSMYCLG